MAQREITAREFRKQVGAAEPEQAVQSGVLRYLKLHRLFAWRQTTGGTPVIRDGRVERWIPSPSRGCPDVLGVFPWGQAFMLELKREVGGRLRYHQAAWLLRALKETPALCMVPSAVDEVAAAVDPLLRWWSETDSGLNREAMMWARIAREGTWLREVRERTMELCVTRLQRGPEKRNH